MVEIFGTAALSMGEWIQLIILSAFPLIVLEILVLFSVGTVFDHRRENVVSYQNKEMFLKKRRVKYL